VIPSASEAAPDLHGPEATFGAVGWATAVLIGSTVGFLLLSFLGRVVAARYLSVPDWGEFNLGLSLVGLLSVVALLGLGQAVARSISFAKDVGERRAIIRWSLALSGTIALLTSALVYVLASPLASLFRAPGLTPVFEILSITIGTSIASNVLASIFQGFEDVVPNAVFVQLLNPALFVGFVGLFVYLHRGLTGILLAYTAASGLALAAQVMDAGRRLPRHLPLTDQPPRPPDSSLWTLSVALWGVTSFAFVTAFADTLILGVYRPASDVGYYSSAMTLARLIMLVAGSLTFIYLPVTARLAREDRYHEMALIYPTATRWVLFLALPLFLLFGFAPGLSVQAAFGSAYGPAAEPLRWLAITAVLATVLGPVNACLAGLGLARVSLGTSLIAALTNIALSFALIPSYGVFGATAAWGISRALYPALGLLTLWRVHRISPFRRIVIAPLVLTIGIGGPLIWLAGRMDLPRWVVVPLFFAGAALFAASLAMTRSLVAEDLIAVSAVEKMIRRPLPRLRRLVGRFCPPALPSGANAP
jgi:O-antigen/teichoic acid export membrane protein